jgi:hypothetical protein
VRGETSTLTSEFQFRRNIYRDVSDADSSDFDFTLNYGIGRNKLSLTYYATPRRLAYVAGNESILSKLHGVEVRYSHRVTRRLRTRVGYEFARETFSASKERDSGRHELSADVRYRFHNLLTPGFGFEFGRVNASSINYSRNEPTLVLLLDSQIKNTAWVSLRYRYGKKDYITTDLKAGNFNRVDWRHDVRLQANIKLTKQWWLLLYNSYTNNTSTRALRGFTGHEIGVGVFFRFP